MKLAIHMSMFCNTWRDDISFVFPNLKQIGYDAVEISLYGAEKEQVRRALRAASKAGLKTLCGTGLSPETDISSRETEIQKRGIEYLKSSVEMIAEEGASMLNGILYAPWQDFCGGRNKEERLKRAAESLFEVGRYAEKKNIQLNCEVINRFEGDLINTLDEGSRFLSGIGLQNVRLLADVFHMNIEEDNMTEALVRNIEQVGCIHICENHRGVPGTGGIDWNGLIRELKKAGYTGYLDLEAFVRSGTEVANALFLWRDMGGDPLMEAEKACHYMRERLGVGKQ